MASKYSSNTTSGYTTYTSPNKSSATDSYPQIKYRQTYDTTEFIQNVQQNKNNTDPEISWRVDTPDEEALKNADMYITENGSTFAITRDTHTLISLSSARDANGESLDNMRAINEIAIDKGGTNFDSFEGNWDFYLHCGYKPVGWVNWDSQYNDDMMSQGWTPDYGTERIIWFEHDPSVAKQMVKDNITLNEWATGRNYKTFD